MKNEINMGVLWGAMKRPNLWIVGIEEYHTNGKEKLFSTNYTSNFPKPKESNAYPGTRGLKNSK